MSYDDDDVHKNGCENNEYYYCPDCKELVHESENNQCPMCKLFIPRVYTCICDILPDYIDEPDWDWIRKERLENPRFPTYSGEGEKWLSY